MSEDVRPLTRDEVLALDPKTYAVAISYGDGSMNVLGPRGGMKRAMKEALDDVERERQLGDGDIKIVIVCRASMEGRAVR